MPYSSPTNEIVAGILLLYLPVYVFPRFDYQIEDDVLVVRRFILGGVPFGRWRVKLTRFRKARLSVMRIPARARVLGRMYSFKGVVLVPMKRRWLGKGSVYITPDDPTAFIGEISAALVGCATGSASLPPGPPPFLASVPRWVTDLLALATALPASIAACRLFYWIRGGEFLGHAPTVTVHTLAMSLLVLVVAVCVWMVCDAFRELRRTGGYRYLIWLLVMILLFPSAWLFYLAEWRPRASLSKPQLTEK